MIWRNETSDKYILVLISTFNEYLFAGMNMASGF